MKDQVIITHSGIEFQLENIDFYKVIDFEWYGLQLSIQRCKPNSFEVYLRHFPKPENITEFRGVKVIPKREVCDYCDIKLRPGETLICRKCEKEPRE